MTDDNIVYFTPHLDDSILICPDCGQTHWLVYANGSIECSDCGAEMGGYALIETGEETE